MTKQAKRVRKHQGNAGQAGSAAMGVRVTKTEILEELVAIAKVVRAAYPDPTQFRPKEPYYDAKSSRDAPRWFAVDIQLESEFETPVSLPEIKEQPGLEEMVLVKRSRLSIQPVTPAEWQIVNRMGCRKS